MRTIWKKALRDLRANRFLNGVTVFTIALAVVIAGAFLLFFTNASQLVDSWRSGLRVMVYLKADIDPAQRLELGYRLKQMPETAASHYISRRQALEELKRQMPGQASLFTDLKNNPLPDAFELELSPQFRGVAAIESLAGRLKKLPVAEVEYGQQWLEKATSAFEIFRLAGLVIGALFFTATVFIVGNTIRLVVYSRREEIEIMRLVGATDRFIATPFYLLGLLQGAAGGLLGLGLLLVCYLLLRSQLAPSLWMGRFQLHFLPVGSLTAVVIASMLVGGLGCFLSLQQFLKR